MTCPCDDSICESGCARLTSVLGELELAVRENDEAAVYELTARIRRMLPQTQPTYVATAGGGAIRVG